MAKSPIPTLSASDSTPSKSTKPTSSGAATGASKFPSRLHSANRRSVVPQRPDAASSSKSTATTKSAPPVLPFAVKVGALAGRKKIGSKVRSKPVAPTADNDAAANTPTTATTAKK
jgi:hypothetical protein